MKHANSRNQGPLWSPLWECTRGLTVTLIDSYIEGSFRARLGAALRDAIRSPYLRAALCGGAGRGYIFRARLGAALRDAIRSPYLRAALCGGAGRGYIKGN